MTAAALLLLPAIAHADCPTNLPFNEVSEKAAQLHLKIEKASDALVKTIDGVAGRPEGLEDTEMFLMTSQESVSILLVKEGIIVCTSPVLPKEDFFHKLGITDANG